MRGARHLLFGAAALGSVACQALWGMHPFEAADHGASSGGGLGGASSGGQGPDCAAVDACSESGFCWQGACETECTPGRGFCEGARLRVCNASGDGLVDEAGELCATPELCDRGTFQGACPAPTCEAGEYECHVAADGPIRARVCPSARTEWKTVEICASPEAQCSQDSRGCFALGMDETEVTRESYAAFLNSPGGEALIDAQPRVCEWNKSFVPNAGCLASEAVCEGESCAQHPQVCVDWCDALAFCQAQGKSLCGTLGDQKNVTLDLSLASDPTFSSWANACWAEAPDGCESALLTTTMPVGEGCKVRAPGYERLRGISGNVSEWEYACERSMEGPSDESGRCLVRGSSFADGIPECLSAIGRRRNEPAADVGFRCCSLEAGGAAGAASR